MTAVWVKNRPCPAYWSPWEQQTGPYFTEAVSPFRTRKNGVAAWRHCYWRHVAPPLADVLTREPVFSSAVLLRSDGSASCSGSCELMRLTDSWVSGLSDRRKPWTLRLRNKHVEESEDAAEKHRQCGRGEEQSKSDLINEALFALHFALQIEPAVFTGDPLAIHWRSTADPLVIHWCSWLIVVV